MSINPFAELLKVTKKTDIFNKKEPKSEKKVELNESYSDSSKSSKSSHDTFSDEDSFDSADDLVFKELDKFQS